MSVVPQRSPKRGLSPLRRAGQTPRQSEQGATMKTRIPGLLGAALLAAPLIGHSTPITYDFSVDGGSTGALAGVHSSGSFSFDSSIIPAAGGLLTRTGLLTDLAF